MSRVCQSLVRAELLLLLLLGRPAHASVLTDLYPCLAPGSTFCEYPTDGMFTIYDTPDLSGTIPTEASTSTPLSDAARADAPTPPLRRSRCRTR